jgi:hypothetical protein
VEAPERVYDDSAMAQLREQVSRITQNALATAAKKSQLDEAFARLGSSMLNVQLLYEHQCVATTIAAAGTTETLMGEAKRLFRLEGRKVILLVDGKRLRNGVPLSQSALVCSMNQMYMRNVTVKTEW